VSRDLVNLLWFGGWLVAVAVLFAVALRLPLDTRRRGALRGLYVWGIVAAAVAVVVVANAALMRHDVHIDLTRERTFTPSMATEEVVAGLTRDVTLTYFYHARDDAGRRAKHLVEVLGRRNPRLHVRTVDPDRQPTLAQTYGVRLYNAAVIEAEGRRIQVAGTDDVDIAIGIQRVLRQRVTTVCFMEGHGEYPLDNFEFHTHVETAHAHSHGDKSSARVEMEGHGAGRLRRALEALGFEARKIITATLREIPPDCAIVVAVNPRTTYLPAESEALAAYLDRGGAALLMYDLGFVVEPRLAALLARLGLRLEQQAIVDPLDHYATDHETVAVPVYEAHPVTTRVALTFYPGVRPLTLLPPPPGVRVTPLALSSKESFSRAVTPIGARAVPMAASPAPTRTGRHVVAAAVEGTTAPFRVVVVGDGDFASNSFLPYMANSDFVLSAIRWLGREDQQTRLRPAMPVPAMVLLTKRQMQAIFLVVEGLLPLSAVIVGGVVWWKRR
jgi:gliding motility-associatede transport system auxiliary component